MRSPAVLLLVFTAQSMFATLTILATATDGVLNKLTDFDASALVGFTPKRVIARCLTASEVLLLVERLPVGLLALVLLIRRGRGSIAVIVLRL